METFHQESSLKEENANFVKKKTTESKNIVGGMEKSILMSNDMFYVPRYISYHVQCFHIHNWKSLRLVA